MGFAPYFSRVRDAVGGTAAVTVDELEAALEGALIEVRFDGRVADDGALSDGAQTLTNLLARLYPRLSFRGPSVVTAAAAALALTVNPEVEIVDHAAAGAKGTSVLFGGFDDTATVSADATGWRVLIDQPRGRQEAVMAPAAQGLACLAAAEVFRDVFAEALGERGRRARQPGAFDLIGNDEHPAPGFDLTGLDLGDVHLAGAGAIGQACVSTLRSCGVVGRMTVVDPEVIELSNLQRYVLSTLTDVGVRKVDVVARSLQEVGWTVEAVPSRWGQDERSQPRQQRVLVALDSARDRLGVAVGLHHTVYNAWTQPADVGWSRHENFGTDACLACLYYPDRPRLSDDELIAQALRQPRLRVLSYLVTGTPVDVPLPLVAEAANMPAPEGAAKWLERPLVADLVAAGLLTSDEAPAWSGRLIGALYSEGICGGGILSAASAGVDAERVVPLAHQSAFAGVMLAVETVAATHPLLRAARSSYIENRLDLLLGLPQRSGRPRTPTRDCVCRDPAYVKAAMASP